MAVNLEENVTIVPPKPFWNKYLMFIAFCPLLILSGSLFTYINLSNYLGVGVILILAFVGTFLLLYLPNEEKSLMISKDTLKVVKKGQLVEKHVLSNIDGFLLKYIRLIGDRQIQFIIEKTDGTSITLYKLEGGFTGRIFSYRPWKKFTKKLAELAGKTYKTEIWTEDYGGKLLLTPSSELPSYRKRSFVTFSLPIIICFLGAICWKIYSQGLILFGSLVVLLNSIGYFYYVFKNKKRTHDFDKNNLIIIAFGLSKIVSHIGLYLLFVFVLSGFSLADVFRNL